MHILNGIAYADDNTPPIRVKAARPLDDYMLYLKFSTGEERIFDMKPLINCPAFAPLKEPGLWSTVCVEYGMPVWSDGDIDIAPEYLYENSAECGADSGNSPADEVFLRNRVLRTASFLEKSEE